MEDVLSCDDAVLQDTYLFHLPPNPDMIRLPPLLWSRIRFDLKEYLTTRQVINMLVCCGWSGALDVCCSNPSSSYCTNKQESRCMLYMRLNKFILFYAQEFWEVKLVKSQNDLLQGIFMIMNIIEMNGHKYYHGHLRQHQQIVLSFGVYDLLSYLPFDLFAAFAT